MSRHLILEFLIITQALLIGGGVPWLVLASAPAPAKVEGGNDARH